MNILNKKQVYGLKKEIHILLAAFMFYTRLPVHKLTQYNQEYLALSIKYFPVVGYVVGVILAGIYLILESVLPNNIAVILAVIISILATGALHEDGLADACDAFGGGWTKESVLQIMKDSNIGVYGTLSLIAVFFLKIHLLIEIYGVLSPIQLVLFTITAQAISRFLASLLVLILVYVGDANGSKSKGMVQKSHIINYIIAGTFALLPLLLLAYKYHWLVLGLIFPLLILKLILGNYFKRRIGGYTGDCLGATQQITEIIFYVGFLFLWKFI